MPGDPNKDDRPQVVVGIATYRRPQLLAELLASLERQTARASFDVVVVDNDVDESARSVVEAWHPRPPLRKHYRIEPTPGIAAARNSCLDAAQELGASFIAFIDDDEEAAPGWLAGLLRVQNRTEANLVTGPVEYRFAEDTPKWIRRGGFFINYRPRPGQKLPFAATNNLLLAMDSLSPYDSPWTRFDDRFGLTGGSDTIFTSRLVRRGHDIAYADDAMVVERVPADRTTLRWVARRAQRTGEVYARVLLDANSKLRTTIFIALRAIAMIFSGLTQVATFPVTRKTGYWAPGLRRGLRGWGMLRCAFGLLTTEYSR